MPIVPVRRWGFSGREMRLVGEEEVPVLPSEDNSSHSWSLVYFFSYPRM